MVPDFALFLFFCGLPGFLGGVSSFLGVFRFFLGVFLVFMGCFWFSWGVPGFLGGVPGFLGVFLVFLGVFRVFGGVPGFSGFPECSVMFRCSGVPVFRVPCSGVLGSPTCPNQTFCIFVRHQCANSGGNPFKVRCQDLAKRKQDIFWNEAVPRILQSSAKTLKVQNEELFKTTIL